jgi:drug/metabolite transporter (DMT)-like permease
MQLLPQLLALAASLCFAGCFVAGRRALQISNPTTVTLIALIVQTVTLGAMVFFTEGLPQVSMIAFFLFVIVGILMAVIRVFSFTGVAKVGAARAASLRSTFPLFSVLIAITMLGEKATIEVLFGTILVVSGIILISWQRQEKTTSAGSWQVLIPLLAAFLAGVVHPIRRYALTLSNYPILFAALVGIVALITLVTCVPFLGQSQRLAWRRGGLVWVIVTGLFQTAGFLLVNLALGAGPVVHVIPIVASFPMWVLVGTVIFLRDLERVNRRTIAGTCLTVAGTVAILLA